MKKNYIVPATEVAEVAMEQMLAASIGIGSPIESGEEVTADVKAESSSLWDVEW